jgi:hypothetical protein
MKPKTKIYLCLSVLGLLFIKGSSLLQPVIPVREIAQEAGPTIDILFLGVNYEADETRFTKDAERFADELLSHDPFRSRASSFRFSHAISPISLKCQRSRDPERRRVIECDQNAGVKAAKKTGLPWDYVVAVVNDPEYAGSGGKMSVLYNGEYGPQIFVHEFAHTFGGLNDEYSIGRNSPGKQKGVIHGNCYAGTPPAPEWEGIVSLSEYRRGCAYDDWYRSSENSIMNRFERGVTFNRLSRKLLNDKIDAALTAKSKNKKKR